MLKANILFEWNVTMETKRRKRIYIYIYKISGGTVGCTMAVMWATECPFLLTHDIQHLKTTTEPLNIKIH